MATRNNPYINPANPYEKLNTSQEKLKNHPEIVRLSKLCYEVFYCQEEGKQLLAHLNELFLMKKIPQIGIGDYGDECIRSEALRSFVIMFNEHIESHKQRIAAEVNQK